MTDERKPSPWAEIVGPCYTVSSMARALGWTEAEVIEGGERLRLLMVRPGILVAVDTPAATLVAVATCRVGAPMVLLIDRGAPGVWFTRRTCATVSAINRAASVPPSSVGPLVP